MHHTQIPTFGFLYVAGYIGHVGRQYIIKVKEDSKPTDKEIILDVPLALKLAFQGWAWPLAAVQVGVLGCACERACVCVCVRACVRACGRVCVRACV